MKKWLIGLVLVLALAVSLLPGAAGAQNMYFMAVNETVLDFSADNLPFVSGGSIYVPYTMFMSRNNGGINLGIFHDWNRQNNIFSLYSRTQPVLTFDIGAGTAYDTMGNSYSFRAILKDSMVYLPAHNICRYFGLQYSNLYSEYGIMVRVKQEGSYYLGDYSFLDSATEKLKEQRKQFDRIYGGIDVSEPTPTPTPTPTATPGPVQPQRKVTVSFSFRCDKGESAGRILDTLDTYGLKGLFFFRPEDLAERDEEIRRMLGTGHKVGLLVNGDTVEACVAQAEEGNRLLGHIARMKTDFLLVDGEDSLRTQVAGEGWACWWGNMNAVPKEGDRESSLALTLRLNLELKVEMGRILMDDSHTSYGTLGRLLPQIISDEDYTFRAVKEVDL